MSKSLLKGSPRACKRRAAKNNRPCHPLRLSLNGRILGASPPQGGVGQAAGGAPVAQLDRAPDYESGGQRFESFRARQTKQRLDIIELSVNAPFDGPQAVDLRPRAPASVRARTARFTSEGSGPLRAERVMQCGDGLHDTRVSERVIDRPRFAPRGDEPILPKPGEMLREGGLTQSHRVLQVGDASFAFVELAQDHQPMSIGEGFEEEFDLRCLRDELIERAVATARRSGFALEPGSHRRRHISAPKRSRRKMTNEPSLLN